MGRYNHFKRIAFGTRSKLKNIPNLTLEEDTYLKEIIKYSWVVDILLIVCAALLLILKYTVFSDLQIANSELMKLVSVLIVPGVYGLWYYLSKVVFYQKFTNIELLDSVFEKVELHKKEKKSK